jgi:hypothetical protein
MRACYDGDTYILLPGIFKWMDQVVGEEIFILILGADVLKLTVTDCQDRESGQGRR